MSRPVDSERLTELAGLQQFCNAALAIARGSCDFWPYTLLAAGIVLELPCRVTWLGFLVILGAVAFYFTTPDERSRFFARLRGTAESARDRALRRRASQKDFYDALRERTLVPFVTIALVLLNLGLWFEVVGADGSATDPATLISFGANFGPRTSNGEWWRLLAATFVHASLFEVMLTTACLAQLGLMLERLAGHTVLAVVYLSAGAFASLAGLASAPVVPNIGSAGAVLGLYGLLLSALFWGTLRRGATSVPWKVVRDFLPLAAVLAIYVVFAGSPGGWVELAGFSTGLMSGVFLTRGISEFKPPARRVAVIASAAMVLALASTLPLRGITDARPEVDRVIAAEERATSEYRAAVVRFNEGLVPATALTRVIERHILPEIRATRERLEALSGVPRVHQPMVEAAQEYLRLREESWRLRSEALQRTNMGTLRKADRTEWESLEAFKRIRTGA
jgi:rhomboid protease GluP